MHLHLISIFPDIFTSFFGQSLLAKAQESWLLTIHTIDPRSFCDDKHQSIDDTPYGWGAGMLMKAEPLIKAVESVLETFNSSSYQVIMPSPSTDVFDQRHALSLSSYEHLIFVCGRYEGIDHRFEVRCQQYHAQHFRKLSVGSFVLLGWEVASMTMIEAITRLIPGVIKESSSRQDESYNPLHWMYNIEHPHYTRPPELRGMKVPDVLLSGDDKAIADWRKSH